MPAGRSAPRWLPGTDTMGLTGSWRIGGTRCAAPFSAPNSMTTPLRRASSALAPSSAGWLTRRRLQRPPLRWPTVRRSAGSRGAWSLGRRALGARSILADPRSPGMQKTLNLKVKYRESFRPFAPSVLREDATDWFELDTDSPYMLLIADVAADKRIAMTGEQQELFGINKLNVPRSTIPAVTHVDYSARVQTVHADTNPRYYALLSAFKSLTGCPVLVNTSFNVRGEPIVCTPEEAFRCFMGTELDLLVAGNVILRKADQDPALRYDYKGAFEPD